MISAEAPVLFSKACELFILDLTMRAWSYTDENKRRTLQRSDVAEAIVNDEMFDFLIDIVPREDNPSEGFPQAHKLGHEHPQSDSVSTEGVLDTLDLDQDHEFGSSHTSGADFSSRQMLESPGFPKALSTTDFTKPLPSPSLEDNLSLLAAQQGARFQGQQLLRLPPLSSTMALQTPNTLAPMGDAKWNLNQLGSIPRGPVPTSQPLAQPSLGGQAFSTSAYGVGTRVGPTPDLSNFTQS